MTAVDCYIDNKKRLDSLLKLFKLNRIEILLNDFYQLPNGFNIKLVDKTTINKSDRDFHSYLRTNCWILIDDGTENQFPDINKTAIHQVNWGQLLKQCSKELLLVIEKCINVNNLFTGSSTEEFIQIQMLDESYKVFRADRIYQFTVIDKVNFMHYKSEEGALKKVAIQNSLSFLEDKLKDFNFYRTHKKFLVNANQLSDNLDLSSNEIKFRENLSAKLAKTKQDDFVNYLENL